MLLRGAVQACQLNTVGVIAHGVRQLLYMGPNVFARSTVSHADALPAYILSMLQARAKHGSLWLQPPVRKGLSLAKHAAWFTRQAILPAPALQMQQSMQAARLQLSTTSALYMQAQWFNGMYSLLT